MQTSENSHILAVADEGGYVSLYNTRLKFPPSSTHQQNAGKLLLKNSFLILNFALMLCFLDFYLINLQFTEKSKMSEWVAHENAIFDVCWIKVHLSFQINLITKIFPQCCQRKKL